jgi:hypothetical protein
MEGAAMRMANRRSEVWLTAMLPHMEKPPQLYEFVHGEKDKRSERIKCIEAWDKIDRALARNH